MNFSEGSLLVDNKINMKTRVRRFQRLTLVFVLIGSLFASSFALAEDLTVDLNTEQRKLNNEAIAALSSTPPNPEVAIQLMQAALLMGTKGNVLYLTLGRAYQLSGQCKDAEGAYKEAWQAPRVAGIAQADVIERIERYREEMATTCTGTLVIHCSNPDTDLVIAGETVACNEPLEMKPGEYEVKAYLGSSQTTELSVEIRSMEQTRVQIALGGGTVDTTEAVKELHPQEVVAFALTEAENAQLRANKRLEADRIAAEKNRLEEERKRLEQDRLALEREMLTDEQQKIAEERRRLEARREAAERGELAEYDAAEETESRKRRRNKKLDMSADNEMKGWYGQAYLGVPMGGYLVQANDGFMGTGLMFGGTGAASLGYAFSHLIGLEAYGKVDYLGSSAIAIKESDSSPYGKDDQILGLESWRYLGELRAWLGFISPGFFIDYRSQLLEFYQLTKRDDSFIGGPTLSLSTAGMFREDGYVMFTGRWAPMLGGEVDVFSLEISAASGYANFSFEYTRLTGEEHRKSTLKTGEQLLFNLGFRLPFSF